MKRMIVVLLILCLFLPVIATAEHVEWTCPQCGTICMSVQNFCVKEGQPAPWVWTCSECGMERNTDAICKGCGKPQLKADDDTVAVQNEYQVGDVVTFGHYPQTTAGTDSTPIDWYVLDIENNKALLLCVNGLDVVRYGKRYDETWEKSVIRSFLNVEFIDQAFVETEQSAIQVTYVDNSTAHIYYSNGKNTYDRVFLLSNLELKKYLYEKEKRECTPTDYARKKNKATWWWLRVPAYSKREYVYQNLSAYKAVYYQSVVHLDGSLKEDGDLKISGLVRPALWVDLSALNQ